MNEKDLQAYKRIRKNVEYWVEEVDEYGDIVNHVYQTNNKKEALQKALEHKKQIPSDRHIELEKVLIKGSNAEGVLDMQFEDLTHEIK